MISFECDYLEGCHEKILEAFAATNRVQQPGYGNDDYCSRAKEKIRAACECPEADIWFLAGGTLTNQLVIDSMLKPYEGVLAATTGHVNCHEAGAIEFTGHKVLTLPAHDGKVDAAEADAWINAFYKDGSYDHMVFPGMIYISHPTEYGTLYTADELRALSKVCHAHSIPLYMDGARLGYGLASPGTDVTLPMIAELTDVFYIGGTKVGALCGEALVFTKNNTPSRFLTRIKQHGDLTAKGRLLGVQFDTLFTDGLYFEIGKHTAGMTKALRQVFIDAGIPFFMDSPTNQQFVILDNELMERLASQVGFEVWEPYDADHTVVRFATSWATTIESINTLRNILEFSSLNQCLYEK